MKYVSCYVIQSSCMFYILVLQIIGKPSLRPGLPFQWWRRGGHWQLQSSNLLQFAKMSSCFLLKRNSSSQDSKLFNPSLCHSEKTIVQMETAIIGCEKVWEVQNTGIFSSRIDGSHFLFKGHNVIVNIVVHNCQRCNQCLKCQVSEHKPQGLPWNFLESLICLFSENLKIIRKS